MHRTGAILVSIGLLALIAANRSEQPEESKNQRKRRKRKRRSHGAGYITISTRDKFDTVRESPEQLLAQARKRLRADITLTELTAARLIVSEHARCTDAEGAAILDAELNRAAKRRLSLTAHLTSAGTYGKQGGSHGTGKKRPASTRHDPKRRHLRIARKVLSGELRGISKGAVRFFDPASQWSSHQKWLTGESKRRHCHPAVIIERWTHDKKWQKKAPPCTLRAQSGRSLQEWVGPIDDIDPMRVMLLRPAKAGPEHKRRYQEARRLILERFPLPRKGQGIATL